MARKREHYHMASALVTYLRDGAPKQRHMNFILTTEDRVITMEVLNQGRKAASLRLMEEAQVTAEQMTDFIYMSIFYLGHMTEREFLAQAPVAPPAYQA